MPPQKKSHQWLVVLINSVIHAVPLYFIPKCVFRLWSTKKLCFNRRVEDVINTDVKWGNSVKTWGGEKNIVFWQARQYALGSQQWRFHLHELVEKTIYCPFRCLLKRLPHTERRHDEQLWVLDLRVNLHGTGIGKIAQHSCWPITETTHSALVSIEY